MAAYELTPMKDGLADMDWVASRHSGMCIVIAEDEPAARVLATQEFCGLAGSVEVCSPWLREDLVSARQSKQPPPFQLGTVIPVYEMHELAKAMGYGSPKTGQASEDASRLEPPTSKRH